MTAEHIRKSLRQRYNDHRRYAVIEEVGLSTGGGTRRIDMVIFDCYQSNGFRIDGIEIKVSKSDLRRELEDPAKHALFFDAIDFYTLACPKEVLDGMMQVIPPKWGIIQVNEDGSTRYIRKPLAQDDRIEKAIPRGFVASSIRAVLAVQPSTKELQEEYERGRKDMEGYYKSQKSYQRDYVREQYERLKTLDEIERRFRLWGDDIKALDEFEAFQKLDISMIKRELHRACEGLAKIEGYLNGKEERKGVKVVKNEEG